MKQFVNYMSEASRGHSLMTKALAKQIPGLGETDGLPSTDRTVFVKLFSPYNNWTWYILEYDPDTQECFGLVKGFETEFGYFSLNELEEAGALVERDLYFYPTKLNILTGV